MQLPSKHLAEAVFQLGVLAPYRPCQTDNSMSRLDPEQGTKLRGPGFLQKHTHRELESKSAPLGHCAPRERKTGDSSPPHTHHTAFLHQTHPCSHFCHHTAFPEGGRLMCCWHKYVKAACIPGTHSSLHQSCPHNHCPHHIPKPC